MPFDVVHEDIQPVYETIKGWNKNLSGIHDVEELPDELCSYIDYIEKKTNVPVSIVSFGPDRTQTVQRKKEVVIS
jgi:adenylosuccinate synthase